MDAARNQSYPHCGSFAALAQSTERAWTLRLRMRRYGRVEYAPRCLSPHPPHIGAHTAWVDAVLTGRPKDARRHIDHAGFPIALVRRLDDARAWLRKTTLGSRRFGLVASSGCTRPRPYGLEVSAGFRKELDYAAWFTAPRDDLRSSFALETVASAFEAKASSWWPCAGGGT
jgi:hypothetical protein